MTRFFQLKMKLNSFSLGKQSMYRYIKNFGNNRALSQSNQTDTTLVADILHSQNYRTAIRVPHVFAKN